MNEELIVNAYRIEKLRKQVNGMADQNIYRDKAVNLLNLVDNCTWSKVQWVKYTENLDIYIIGLKRSRLI